MERRKQLFLVFSILLLVTMACQFTDSGPSEAELTLEALYVEQTITALNADNSQQTLETQVALNVQQTLDAQPKEVIPTDSPPADVPPTATDAPPPTDPPLPTQTPIPQPTATQPIVHTIRPGEPGWIHQWWMDTNTKNYAAQKRAIGGEKYFNNQFERPFTSTEMIYHADVDLTKVEISYDNTFYYITLYLSGLNQANNTLNGWYGVEFDSDMDGRGDYLLWAKGTDSTQWIIDEVYVYTDVNNDVGGFQPLKENAPNYSGDSYETVLFSPLVLTDPDAAWVRRHPTNATAIQVAVKNVTLGNPSIFLWNGWADNGFHNPQNFDYNDFYSNSQAGSPYSNSIYYPVKELELVDNTCRLPFGFEPTGLEPGVCWQPTPTPTQPPALPTPTLPPRSSCDCSYYGNITDEKCCVTCGYWWSTDVGACYPVIY